MALVAITGELFIAGAWTVYPGLETEGWSYQSGPDVETGARAGKIEFTFNNDTLELDPTNVTSTLYGKVGRNTPTRVRISGASMMNGEASALEPERTIDHVVGSRGRALVKITSEGLLRRLSRWTDQVISPMRRRISSYAGLLGYWPFEDPSTAGSFTNLVIGGGASRYSGTVTLAGDSGAGGSAPVVQIGTGGTIRGTFIRSSASGYQLCWVQKLPAQPATATYQTLLQWQDSRGRAWYWNANNVNVQIVCNSSDGTNLITVGSAVPVLTVWTRFRIKITVSASTISVEPAWYPQDGAVITGFTTTFTDTVTGQPTTWNVGGNTYVDNSAFGHLFATTDTTLNLTGGASEVSAFNGYINETAGSRFIRLMGEAALTCFISGTSARSLPMGRQRPGTLLDLITQCAQTDGALLYDEPSTLGIVMATFNGRANRTPILTLALTDVATVVRKAVDDVGVVNQVTLSNLDGTTASATLTTGSMSILPPPAGVGVYKGGSDLDINCANATVLGYRANWEMRKGTLDRPRYTQIVIDLLKSPALTTAVGTVRPGDWITVSGLEPSTVTLQVISMLRQGNAVNDRITFNCLPAEMFMVAKFNDTNSRLGSGSTTIGAGGITTTATAVPISTTEYGDQWSTTGVPYQCVIYPPNAPAIGEVVTVTAMTAGAGGGPYTQTATVTRSVNGVVLAHAAGDVFNIARVTRYGLG